MAVGVNGRRGSPVGWRNLLWSCYISTVFLFYHDSMSLGMTVIQDVGLSCILALTDD